MLRSISPNSRRGFARSPLCTFYGASLRFASNSYPLTSFCWKLLSAVQTGRTPRMLILIDVGAVPLWLVLSCGAVPCSEKPTSNELSPEDLPRQSGDLERAWPAAAPIGAVSKPVGESRLCPSRMCRRGRQSSWWSMDFTRLFIRRRAGRAGWLASMSINLARSADESAHEAIIGIQALVPGCGLPGSSNGATRRSGRSPLSLLDLWP